MAEIVSRGQLRHSMPPHGPVFLQGTTRAGSSIDYFRGSGVSRSTVGRRGAIFGPVLTLCSKSCVRPMRPNANCPFGASHYLGHFSKRTPLKPVQLDHFPLTLGYAFQELADAFVTIEILEGRASRSREFHSHGRLPPSRSSPVVLTDEVHGYGEQPRS